MKNAVITGCSSGFGRLTALTLARKGYKVWATMRNPDGRNLTKKDEILELSTQEDLSVEVIELDVTSDDSVADAIDLVTKTDGKVDVLVNNAGVMYVGISEAYSIDQVKDQFDINFFGAVRTTNAVLPHMRKERDGLVINVSSLAGRLSFPYFGIYCASKHALEAYSQSISYELAPFGVEVSVNEPGPFGTGLLYSGPKEENKLVIDGYNEHKDVPKAMLKNFEAFYGTDDALDPQVVADDIAKVVDSPKGQRPFRVVSGIDYGTIDLNEKVAPIQESLVKDSLQMGHLLSVN